jgi:hypothetical protein
MLEMKLSLYRELIIPSTGIIHPLQIIKGGMAGKEKLVFHI